MNASFPDAEVGNFENLIESIRLPDEGDRHVLAAAIRCHADLIVTKNLRDFPMTIIRQYDIEVQDPDEFISNLIDLDRELSCTAFLKMVKRLKNPPKTKKEVISTLRKNGLVKSADRLKNNC